jgi:hypothetical protein
MATRNVKCEFGPGVNAEWKDGELRVSRNRFGPPGDKSAIHYDSINVAAGTARVIGTAGSGNLTVMESRLGLTLLEEASGGGLTVTTIYGSYDRNLKFPAVMSKHIDLLGPFPQQYYGSCVAWE